MRKYNIPIFVPHKGCPYDCVFCNQKKITGHIQEIKYDDVTNTINQYLETLPETDRNIEVAFFGGSFTGIPIDVQSGLMNRVVPFIEAGTVDGIRLSTRPDYISYEILDNLKAHGVTTIELGVQSMSDSVLASSNRGHTSGDVREAVSKIRKYNFKLGLQMMTGLVGDTQDLSIYTANEIIKLRPDFVRIYPTLVIKDTYLEKMYNTGKYTPQTLEEAVDLSKKLLLMFEAENIGVIRIGLQPTDEINSSASVVAGPFHSSFRELVESSIYLDLIKKTLDKNKKIQTLYVNTKEISKAIGNNKMNIKTIKDKYDIQLIIKGDNNIGKKEVREACY